jgi:hypothetical protein
VTVKPPIFAKREFALFYIPPDSGGAEMPDSEGRFPLTNVKACVWARPCKDDAARMDAFGANRYKNAT